MEATALEAVVAVQLLHDPLHKPKAVSDCPMIPKEPKAIGRKSHSLFNKNEIIIKELKEWTNAGSRGELQALVSRFMTKNLNDPSVSGLIASFERFLVNGANFNVNEEHYYIHLISFIDLLLTFKSGDSDKKVILAKRANLMSKSFVPLPDIHDNKTRQMLCECFGIDDTTLFLTIQSIQSKISRSEVVAYIKDNGLSKKYQAKDFHNEEMYHNWVTETTDLENSIIREFGGQVGVNSFPYIPKFGLSQTVRELSKLVFSSNPEFIKLYMDCLRIWQFDPFELQFIFMELVPHSTNLTEFGSSLNRAMGLALTCAPIQVDFLDWPVFHQRRMITISMQIYSKIKPTLNESFKYFFDDQKGFTNGLIIIKQLKITSNDLGPRKAMKDEFAYCLQSRSSVYNEKAGINKGEIGFDQMATYLTIVSRDINLLYNWKVSNPSLNTTFGIYEYGSKVLMTPVLKFVKDFVNSMKSSPKHVTNSKLLNPENRQSFSSFLDKLNSLKDRTGFNFDYQSELYPSFHQLVLSWQDEMQQQVKTCIAHDNLQRLPGTGVSKSAQNIKGIMDGYISLLDSFQWKDADQLSKLEVLLYKMISSYIDYYADHMFSIVQKKLVKLVDLRGDACTALNNLISTIQYVTNLRNKPSILESQATLKKNGNWKLSKPRKFVSISIENAVNVEDSKGLPLSLKVSITGILNGETRVIYKDFSPDWFEEFNGYVADNQSNNLKIALLYEDHLYRSITQTIDLTRQTQQHKIISLSPKPGKLNLSTRVEFERNDPVFHLDKTLTIMQKNVTRAIRLFVDEYTKKLKDIFSHDYISQSLSQAPPSTNAVGNYKRLMDIKLNEYTASMRNIVFPEMYNNLEDQLFDQIVTEIWQKAMQRAEDLILPRLSAIDSRVDNKLNKRKSIQPNLSLASLSIGGSSGGTSAGNSSNSSSVRNSTSGGTAEMVSKMQVIRVIEWCQKLFEMVNTQIINSDIQNQSAQKLNQLANIRKLSDLDMSELMNRYYHAWDFISHQMIGHTTKISKNETDSGWDHAQSDKRLLMRVLLSKGNFAVVKKLVEAERRFERMISVECEIRIKGV